jgi:hypothetical protein
VGGSDFVLSTPTAVRVADLDDGGRLDVVVANGSRLSAFYQDQSVTFEPAVAFAGRPLHLALGQSFTATSVEVADLDSDGDLDLAGAVNIPAFGLFLQASPGEFNRVPSSTLKNPGLLEPRHVGFGDIDGDGDRDLVAAYAKSDLVGVLRQTSPAVFATAADTVVGLFTPPVHDLSVPPGAALVSEPRAAVPADVNGDGVLDVVTACRLANGVGVFLGDGAGNLGEPATGASSLNLRTTPHVLGETSFATIGVEGGGPVALAVVDLDADGRLDIASACAGGGFFDAVPDVPSRMFLYLQDPAFGLLPFDHVAAVPFPATGPSSPVFDDPVTLVAIDVVGDGDLELLSANEGSENLTIIDLVSGPSTELTADITLPGPPADVAAGDLDGDGRPDAICAVEDELLIFGDLPSPAFTTVTYTLLSAPRALDLGDLDADGDLDIVVSTGAPVGAFDQYLILDQSAPGVFLPNGPNWPAFPDALDSVQDPQHVRVVDLDLDGDLDVVSANAAGAVANNLTLFFSGH